MTDPDIVSIDHARFGRIESPASSIYRCEGLPGFPEARRLLFAQHDRSVDFAWLVCVEIPDLALVVTDPVRFFPDYDPRPHSNDLRAIKATPDDETEVFAIVTVSDSSATVNLAAPLLIQPKHRLAIQAILGDGVYPVRAPLGSCDSGRPQIESNPQR